LGLSQSTAILADVLVKHAAPLAPIDARTATADLVKRGRADAVIVSGEATGAAVTAAALDEVRSACEGLAPVLIGSGLQLANASTLCPSAHGAIVGTSIKMHGRVDQAVDADRVRALRQACHFLTAPKTESN
jgi:predicted TIM-barrel enzyme